MNWVLKIQLLKAISGDTDLDTVATAPLPIDLFREDTPSITLVPHNNKQIGFLIMEDKLLTFCWKSSQIDFCKGSLSIRKNAIKIPLIIIIIIIIINNEITTMKKLNLV